jgi:hypothetical protein
MALDNNQIENSNIDNDEISLKELIIKIKNWASFLINKWKIILLISLIGGMIGFLVATNRKPTYTAVLTFAMDEDKGGGGGGLSGAIGLASSLGLDLGGGGTSGGAFAASNLAELMKSQYIIEKVLLEPIQINGDNISLAEYYIRFNKLRENWKNKTNLENIQFNIGADRSKFNLQQDSILHFLHKKLTNEDNLIIKQKDKKVSILTIEVISNNELFSKVLCETLASETSSFYIETKSKKARINTNILQNQADSIKNELNNSISLVASETDNVYNLNPSLNIKGAPSKKRQINVTANAEVLKQIMIQLELSKINLRKETPLIQIIDHPILPLKKDKLSRLVSTIIGGLSTSFIYIFILAINIFYKKIMK